jgi:hypothetical protein
MGKMGYGYGSECHLLRWMGRHRKAFDVAVLSEIKREGSKIDWLDFNFKQGEMWPDEELKGMKFLENNKASQAEWEKFWPAGRGIHNWDAVGWVSSDKVRELLLVEAKAHIEETKTNCQAKDPESIKRIKGAFEIVKNALGVPSEIDWMKDYYQVANRIAALHFLHQQKIPSHLLFIYFIGDLRGSGRNSPQSQQEWQKALDDQAERIGLPMGHLLENWIHKLFLKIDSDKIEED